MRKTLGLAALALGIAASVLPVSPASAYCDPLVSSLTGRCDNTCTVTARAYYSADDRTGDALPDQEFVCPM